MTGRDETDQERLARMVDDLDKRAVHNRKGEFVGFRSPLRTAALGGLALWVLLTLVMLVAGAEPVGRYPLAERLLAWTLAVMVVSFVAGVVLLPWRRRGSRVRRISRALLGTGVATLIAASLVLALSGLLPLNLEGLLGA